MFVSSYKIKMSLLLANQIGALKLDVADSKELELMQKELVVIIFIALFNKLVVF